MEVAEAGGVRLSGILAEPRPALGARDGTGRHSHRHDPIPLITPKEASPMPHRTYSEEEVAELFRRTAELQAGRDKGRGDTGGAGLTLPELEAIAAGSGLDPAMLRTAAAELDRPGLRAKTTRVSASEIATERFVPHSLDDETREDLIAELRHRFDSSADVWGMWGMGPGEKTTVQTIGRSIEWQHTNPWSGTQTRGLIQPRGEGVRVRVTRSNVYGGATAWSPVYAPLLALALGFLAAPITGSWVVGVVVGLLALAVLVPLSTLLSRQATERHRREIEHLADDIAEHLAAHAAGASLPAAAAAERAPTPALRLPEDDAGQEAARPQARVRQR